MAATKERCPRCGGPLRQFPEDSGALSRTDGESYVCSTCGTEEALEWQVALAALRTTCATYMKRYGYTAQAMREIIDVAMRDLH